MLSLSSFIISLILISAPVAQCQTESLWGTFKDSLVNGITVDQIKTTGVATTYDYVIVGAGPGYADPLILYQLSLINSLYF